MSDKLESMSNQTETSESTAKTVIDPPISDSKELIPKVDPLTTNDADGRAAIDPPPISDSDG